MTSPRQRLAATRLLSPDLVALAEEPSARDDEEIGIAPDRRRKGREWASQLHDFEGGGIEHFQPRRAVELDRLDAAVRADGHGEAQVAVELAARLGRVVDGAPALNLGAPILLVLGEAVFGGVGTDELLARALLVVVDLLVDLRLQAHGGQREIG